MNWRHWVARLFLPPLLGAALPAAVERLVIIKVDGVPEDVLERELQRVDPETGKSSLPWIDRVFAQQGTRVSNFYVRAISLSAPSWSLLDSGRHLEIRGNAEFDRYTYHVYDYLNFFPFYLGYALSHRVDMPGVEVLDNLGIPLLIDRFPYQEQYQSFQLFQRGVRWKTLQHSLQRRFSRSPRDLLDEWTIGFEIGSSLEDQTEHELIEKLADPRIRYLDYFTGDYDHVAHSTPDPASQRLALQRIDALVGRVWTAIQASPQAAGTALVLVSDHGMNTQPGIYSQGYDLVEFFNSLAGGAHHVVTDRHPRTEFKLKGLDPFVSEVVTPSDASLYLKDAGNQYPTVLLDLDGNERAAVYLRNSDWNALQILLQQLESSATPEATRRERIAAVFRILDKHRARWQSTVRDLREELGALHRAIEAQRAKLTAQPKRWTSAQRELGLDKAARRREVATDTWRGEERSYTQYVEALEKLLALTPRDLDKHHPSDQELIPKRAMGDSNSVYDLENYVIGPSPQGGFQTLDYFPVLTGITVRNNVQAQVGSHPVDFLAMRLPKDALTAALPAEDAPDQDAVWLYHDEDHQAVILSRHDPAGGLELRYLPVRALSQEAGGALHFETPPIAPGFPLELWEDPNLAVTESERAAWLSAWHPELEWFHAIHRTRYSNGLIALHEQFLREPVKTNLEGDARLLARFQARLRRLAEPDFLLFANNHWNFNVRGFNPGGNHGSLFRISTHSVLMLAGGEETGIPHRLVIEEPYDSLSFVPTMLDLLGLPQETAQLPGRPIQEVLTRTGKPVTAP